jgi:PAS domain S-box-containing protein
MLLASMEGRLLDANASACALLGYGCKELLASGLRSVADPSDGRWDAIFEGKEYGRKIKLRMLHRNGNVLPVHATATRRPKGYGNAWGLVLEEHGMHEADQDEVTRLGRVLVENSAEIIALYAVDNSIKYVSPSVEGILGYDPDTLVGRNALDYLHTDDRARVCSEFRQAAEAGSRSCSTEFRFRHADGSWRHFEAKINDLSNDPVVRGLVINSHDVTESKRAQGALEESERRFRQLFEHSVDALLVHDEHGRFLDCNSRACCLLGYKREELLSMGVGDVSCEMLTPEERQRSTLWKQAIIGALEGGSEETLRRKDGTMVPVEVRLGSVDYGGRRQILASVRDITERKRAEQALRKSEGRYQAVIQQAAENIYLIDIGTMRILQANPAAQETLGYSAEELRRMTLYDVVAEDRVSVELDIREVLEKGRSSIGERKYRRKDGTLADFEVVAERVPYEGGDVLCIVAHDVTERKRTDESLRRSLGVLLALREAGQILGSTLQTEEIVTRLLRIMRGVSGLTAAVISVEDELGQHRIWRAVGLDGLWRRARFAPEAEEARRVVLEEGKHRLFRLRKPGEDVGYLVGLCLPLRMKEKIGGVLEAYGPESLAEDDSVEILRSLSAQAASALANARLYGELAERERRLADLVGQLFTAQEEERQRVAYEVHDGLAQLAAAAHQHLQGYASFHAMQQGEGRDVLDRALELVQRTVVEARRVIANLRPTELDDFGLSAALRLEVERLRQDGWRINFESNMDDDERLPVAVETALFRVAQEALTNARKHARTDRARVTLDRLENQARLVVRDWGRGFDSSVPQDGGLGERVGMRSMEERVSVLGGRFRTYSRPGFGTAITVEVPLPAIHPDEKPETAVQRPAGHHTLARKEDVRGS